MFPALKKKRGIHPYMITEIKKSKALNFNKVYKSIQKLILWYGLRWVKPNGELDLLACWKESFSKHRSADLLGGSSFTCELDHLEKMEPM